MRLLTRSGCLPQGSSVWERYGAVQGGTVDDSVFVTMELYTAGLLDKDEALTRLASDIRKAFHSDLHP